jgi:hypothetical protein
MADKKTKKIKVYLALITHRDGENMYAGATPKALLDKVHNYVFTRWKKFMKDREMPGSKKAAVSQFFDVAKEFGAQGEFLTETDDTIEVPV